MEIEIFFADDSSTSDYEIKGYREDVFVKRNKEFYKLSLISIERLNEEVTGELKIQGYHSTSPNLIILDQLSKDKIIFTLVNREKEHYYEQLKPCNSINDTLICFEGYTIVAYKENVSIAELKKVY